VSANTTRYYWYPGDKREWARAAVAVALGAAVAGIVATMTHGLLAAAVVGTATTAVLAGFNFGRRDSRALKDQPDLVDKALRRAALTHSGRAAWRGGVQGAYWAGAAVVVAHLPNHGVLADWVLPVVPAVAGALAHQAGLLYERTGQMVVPTTLSSRTPMLADNASKSTVPCSAVLDATP
jgi:hypothetical protein